MAGFALTYDPYLDHLAALGLRVATRHGQDPDLLGLGAAVSQREGHLPVGGAVCGVGPGRRERETGVKTRIKVKALVSIPTNVQDK